MVWNYILVAVIYWLCSAALVTLFEPISSSVKMRE